MRINPHGMELIRPVESSQTSAVLVRALLWYDLAPRQHRGRFPGLFQRGCNSFWGSEQARLVIDATGLAMDWCVGPIGDLWPDKLPMAWWDAQQTTSEVRSFVLMDFRCDHLKEQRDQPPTFCTPWILGKGWLLEETSLAGTSSAGSCFEATIAPTLGSLRCSDHGGDRRRALLVSYELAVA